MLDVSYVELLEKQNPLPIRVVVGFSSGASSAVAAKRALDTFGKDRVDLFFTDTLWEDDDNYRFVRDCEAFFDTDIIWYADGRTPLQVFDDKQIIPNTLIAPCTFELKIKPFVAYIKRLMQDGHHVIVVLGLDATEKRRMAAPKRNYNAIGASVWYPLMNETRKSSEIVAEWGLTPPRMYAQGYPNANCGGRCIKQGQKGWRLTYNTYPQRFNEVAEWEHKKRQSHDVFANRSILRRTRNGKRISLPLKVFQREIEHDANVSPRILAMKDDAQSTCGNECGVANFNPQDV